MGIYRRQTTNNEPQYAGYNNYYPGNTIYPHPRSTNYYSETNLYTQTLSPERNAHNKNFKFNVETLKSTSFYRLLSLFQLLLMSAAVVYAYTKNTELITTNSKLMHIQEEYLSLENIIEQKDLKLTQAEEAFELIRNKIRSIYYNFDSDSNHDHEEYRYLLNNFVQRYDVLGERMSLLRERLQQLQYEQLFHHYGPGPYHIEMTLAIDDVKAYMTIETAPIELMSHSIYTFIEMIDAKVFDNTRIISRDHIILATLQSIDDGTYAHETDSNKNIRLVFPEYNEQFPHLPNTVAFSGRPGGPQIYINVKDNTDAHGPGGQTQHSLIEEADACFGKIVAGLDALPMLQQSENVILLGLHMISEERSAEEPI